MQPQQSKKPFLFLLFGLGFLFVTVVLWLLIPVPAQAQCGSQASSCKDCHEVQGQLPVNKDGTKWHESHAFGDFCSLCHAGNQQATDKLESHVGMVAPLSDVKGACQSCHTNDAQERAQVYAAILKIDLNAAGAAENATPNATPAESAANIQQPTTAAPSTTNNEMVVNDPNVVDYVQRYNEIVLGQRATNWGDIILIGLIVLVVVGGGGFVILNEMRISRKEVALKRVEGEYPADVVEMLPDLAALKPQSRLSLRNILRQPQKSDKVLGAIDNLLSDEKE